MGYCYNFLVWVFGKVLLGYPRVYGGVLFGEFYLGMFVFVCERIRVFVWVRSSSGRVPPLSLWSLRRGAAASAFLCLRCLGFVMSASAVFLVRCAVCGVSSVGGALCCPAPAAARPRPSLVASVPRGSRSAPVSVLWVALSGSDSVSVGCSDGRVRVCRVPYAVRALGRPVSREAVLARLSSRVGGAPVCFVAAFGYSADTWFVAVEAA